VVRLRAFRRPESRSRSRLTAHLVVFTVLVAVTACESFTSGTYLNCPMVAFLGGTEHITQFKNGPGRGGTDIAVEADMDNLDATCRFSAERVELELSFDIVAVRGRDSLVTGAEIPFFVAVIGAEGEVLVKTPFVASIPFLGASPATWTEDLMQEIVLAEGQRPRSFEVLVGFQLSAEQLDFSLARRGVR